MDVCVQLANGTDVHCTLLPNTQQDSTTMACMNIHVTMACMYE